MTLSDMTKREESLEFGTVFAVVLVAARLGPLTGRCHVEVTYDIKFIH